MQIQLSERQQTTVASAMTIVAVFVILVAIGALFWLIGAFFGRFSTVFLPLAVAAVAALVFQPYYNWLRSKPRLPGVAALIVVFLSGLVPLAAFVWIFGAVVVDQVSDLVAKVPEWWQAGETLVRERAPKVVDFVRRHQILDKVEGQKETIFQGLQVFSVGALSAGAGLLRGAIVSEAVPRGAQRPRITRHSVVRWSWMRANSSISSGEAKVGAEPRSRSARARSAANSTINRSNVTFLKQNIYLNFRKYCASKTCLVT